MRGSEEGLDHFSLMGEIYIGICGCSLYPAACAARQLSCCGRGTSYDGAISSKGMAKRWCNTNARRSAGFNVSSTTSSARQPSRPRALRAQGQCPPQEFIDTTTNKATGFDVDLITAIAQHLGLRATIVTTRFDTILDDLMTKHFDVVISAVNITPDRQKKADFVPYLNAGESLLVQKGNPKNIQSTDDLCGLAVGVQEGTLEQGVLQSSSDNCLEQDKPAININALQDQTAVIQLLTNSRVVATYQDSPVTNYFVKQNPDRFEVGGSVFAAGPEGIAVRKNDSPMFKAIQTALNQLKAAGTYQQLILKWGLTNEKLSAVDSRPHYA